MEYQKQLLKRLLKMIEDNEKENVFYKSAQYKLGKGSFNNVYKTLSENEKRAYYNKGYKYSKSAIQRVRIELNKAMIEWEKGE